ncbi:KTSC domain-containing protein [Pedobacter sp. FW305-3-2-15-E-R2A2]|jgi:hypothetical protein|uniref:KTSC domain-containing protein n=1 Tax=Pedobacter sp. FW305-3-2-15-E-R2A2 TaxID=3140251 RepID=UPI0031400CAD
MPSSVIKSFDYDQDSTALLITFVSGLKYRYANVPPEIFTMLKAAGSKGRYFNHHIRNKFKYRKIRKH